MEISISIYINNDDIDNNNSYSDSNDVGDDGDDGDDGITFPLSWSSCPQHPLQGIGLLTWTRSPSPP